MTSSLESFFSLLFLSLLITTVASLPSTIGVTYNPTTNPSPDKAVSTVQSLKIAAVRLPEPDPPAIRAFSYSNISLLLSVPNSAVSNFASNRSAAMLWLYTHVVPFYPRARITAISVGDDFMKSASDSSDLIPAIRNLHLCLRDLGIHKIAVSTTFSFVNIITTAFPPSIAEFQEPVAEILIKPLLEFLEETNSSFFVNVHPYAVYKLNADMPIGYALFQEQPFNFRDDHITGVRYRNLFDSMVDAVIGAIAVAGHANIPVVVTETGWPSSGGATEPEASEVYAGMYVKGLIDHLKLGMGTPLRKEGVSVTYIYELFDRDGEKQGKEIGEQQWGILYQNMTNKYQIDFSSAAAVAHGSGSHGEAVFAAVIFVVVSMVVLINR